MDPTNEEFHEIIKEYGLTRREAAEMMMCLKSTADRYLCPPRKGRSRNTTYRRMPAFRLKLLIDGVRLSGRKKILN